MKYILVVLMLVVSVYPFSYVQYVWRKKNYIGALGMILLTLLSLSFPVYLIFMR